MKSTDTIVRPHRLLEEVGHGSNLVDDIAFRLQADILHGAFAPGQHLKQTDLCDRYGVSRTPIREALQQLQAQDMVVIVPNKGAIVQSPTASGLMEVYEIRAELEGFAAELAVANWTEDDEIELLSTQAKLTALVEIALSHANVTSESETKVATRIAAVNEEFHAIFRSACRNQRLKGLIVNLQNSVPVRQVWFAVKNANEAHRLNVEDHDEIIDAFRRRSPSDAREATRKHILRAGRWLVEAFGRQDTVD
ncbi:GntR family transcriptional regulator [Acuticoccus mangrovi]|uniref:GntR family transcriptional regulator n=1 Tax=Acuticoccus mangrovi TaxID=2796142 RepID=A0A934IUZ6_9HYPH|nr:GntR family transcriptional regulator [Acuticoccus mangrovi]MBJ3778515.1 GntR family transcriptional regulator [Acuticoccus mangrovi]